MAIQPYTGPFGRAEQIHLLRRALFGVTPGDLAHFNGMGLTQMVDELLTFSTAVPPPLKNYTAPDGNNQPDPSLIDPNVPFGSTWVNTASDPQAPIDPRGARIQSLFAWWVGLMTGQERNLREKLTLFWYNHMPTQALAVFQPEGLYSMNVLLRNQCKGNFRQLIHDVTLEPAMLVYLNGYLNIATAPDENYARELMELFTLGQGSGYAESDVQAAARVLTGFTVQYVDQGQPIVPQTIFLPFLHAITDKQFSGFFNNTVIQGQTGVNGGANELNELLDMLFAKDELSLFICRELYRWFVHGEISAAAETDVIEPLAELFRNNAGAPDQMETVVRALLTSDHFYSADLRGCMIKSPADLVIGDLRLLGMPYPTPAQFEAQYSVWKDLYWLIGYCGQELANPPNVAGWPAYYQFPQYDNIWVDTATFPARNYALQGVLYSGLSTPANLYQPQSQNLEFKIDLVAFTQLLSNPSDPNSLVADVAELLYGTPLSQAVRDQLKTNFLLLGQSQDYYWTFAYSTYVADPNTTDMTAQLVPQILLWMFLDMVSAAEHHIH
ncbi:MAG: DUF1800 domain-containing protein [Flavobacteriales bacterium]|nr:DUF1800 domain-containing protein [Flavobacteriales bacterium]